MKYAAYNSGTSATLVAVPDGGSVPANAGVVIAEPRNGGQGFSLTHKGCVHVASENPYNLAPLVWVGDIHDGRLMRIARRRINAKHVIEVRDMFRGQTVFVAQADNIACAEKRVINYILSMCGIPF